MTLVADNYTVAPGTTTVRGGSNAAPDTVAPSWGAAVLTISGITQTGYTFSASAPATDAVGVTRYLYQIGTGPLILVTGSAPTGAVTGRTPGATEVLNLYARDAAGNTSAPISATVTLPTSAEVTITPDGMWSWFSSPRSVRAGDNLFTGWVSSTGDVGVTKTDLNTKASTHFVLAPALHVDDHCNAAIVRLPDGRLMALYAMHNDYVGPRVRISTNPDDISAWGPETVLSASLPVSYGNGYYLAETGRIYNVYRSGNASQETAPWNCRSYDVQTGTWDAQRTWFQNTNVRPYPQFASNGLDRIDILFTDRHPNQGQATIHHAYMQISETGQELFYKSDGTLIGPGPITPAQATLVYNTTNSWTWDLVREDDGTIHALFSAELATENHRLRYAKCVNGVWGASVEVSQMGYFLAAGEPQYSGGGCIDRLDPTRIYVSRKTAGVFVWELSESRTADGGVTWAKVRDITSSSGLRNCRPFSPINADARMRVVWWAASRYAYWDDYLASIKGIA